MINNENFITEVLTNICDKIEMECSVSNAAFLALLIILSMDVKTWTIDRSYLAKICRAADIVEKDEGLKRLFSASKF